MGDSAFKQENPDKTNSVTKSTQQTRTASVSPEEINVAPRATAMVEEAQAALIFIPLFYIIIVISYF